MQTGTEDYLDYIENGRLQDLEELRQLREARFGEHYVPSCETNTGQCELSDS